MRAQREYWSATWEAEGVMSLSLPGPAGGTDGGVLRDQALHSLLRDMITRVDTWFPRYAASRAQPVLRVDFTPALSQVRNLWRGRRLRLRRPAQQRPAEAGRGFCQQTCKC